MVRWMVDERHRLIEPCEPARPPDPEGLRTRRTMRGYRLSAAGKRVVRAAHLQEFGLGSWRDDLIEARDVDLRREIVAESAPSRLTK